MSINYLIIPILLGISVRGSATLEDLDSATTFATVEDIRLAKSELIRRYLNESIDPCENFYEFACGNWRTYHQSAFFEIETSVSNFIHKDFNRIVEPLLQNPDDNYTKPEWKVKNFYDSCRTRTLSLKAYRRNMKKLIQEFGRMPALEGDKWQHKNFDWIKTIGEISYKYGIGILYGYSFSEYDADPTANQLLMQSQLLLQFEDTSAETIDREERGVVYELKSLIGLKTKTAKKIAKEIVNFAVKLWKANENGGKGYQTTFKEMHQKYSRNLDVMKLVNTSLGYIPDGFVMDMNPSYVEELGTIVKKTPKRVLANYIFYILITKFQSLHSSCLEATKLHFLPILTNMVYRRSDLTETEKEFHQMWQGISATLQNALESNQLKWFDDDSREAALEKLHLMQLYIASFEDINFEELYKDLTFSGSDFMSNVKSIKSFNAKLARKSLNERTSFKHFEIGDYTPTYVPTANMVRFPLSSLVLDYMWSKNAPHAYNYGRLGFAMAHEIMHGFSGSGREFNGLGMSINWIYKDIEASYEERRQCYYDQYHNFTLDNKPLPQDKLQTENLADNAGIYLAYHTYLRWLTDEGRTREELDMETLPHLNYTNKQLYFISYSQFFCVDHDQSSRFEFASKDIHSPNEFRAFFPLLNFGEFAKEFNCPSGSPMNPRKKCSMY